MCSTPSVSLTFFSKTLITHRIEKKLFKKCKILSHVQMVLSDKTNNNKINDNS
jgi:hypothetical protein